MPQFPYLYMGRWDSMKFKYQLCSEEGTKRNEGLQET